MSHIQEKIEEVTTELQQVVEVHNKLVEQKNAAAQRFTELQGSLKTLQELQEDDPHGREDS
jgi:chaperonin cofactor prefoldin